MRKRPLPPRERPRKRLRVKRCSRAHKSLLMSRVRRHQFKFLFLPGTRINRIQTQNLLSSRATRVRMRMRTSPTPNQSDRLLSTRREKTWSARPSFESADGSCRNDSTLSPSTGTERNKKTDPGSDSALRNSWLRTHSGRSGPARSSSSTWAACSTPRICLRALTSSSSQKSRKE